MPRRDERPVPGLLSRREPRVPGDARRRGAATAGGTEPGAAAAGGTEHGRGAPGGSFFGWRLRGAGWIAWGLAAFAVVLAVVWQRAEPLAAVALWGAAGVLCRRCARLVEGPLGPARGLALLGLVALALVLLLAGAAFVARGEPA
ncbi:hypothetical protein [Cellulosimicrobium sp. NPDC055967]|uniref:hypothetical protein n=1 Tax=Cellulosimicrobium sp. NPDC055967 TaxID=3345670 RepID=UPI0035DAA3E0